MTPKARLLSALFRQEVDRPPVWLMRQAGRYLPEYQKLRQKHSTLKMMTTPRLAAEVTLQPVTRFGVDAAILYSDILMIPHALGMGLKFVEGEGPKFDFAIARVNDLFRVQKYDVMDQLEPVFEAVERCCQKLSPDIPLIGFAGGPFTVACYMICGGGPVDLNRVKAFAKNKKRFFQALMNLITNVTVAYLIEQVGAGATAVQLFDTWAGLLTAEEYRAWAKPYSLKIFSYLQDQDIPSLHYIKNTKHLLKEMIDIPSCAISVDSTVDLKTVSDKTKNHFTIQGNLDPQVLLESEDQIKKEFSKMISSIPHPYKGYIANLGHGIHKETSVEHVQLFVKMVKELKR